MKKKIIVRCPLCHVRRPSFEPIPGDMIFAGYCASCLMERSVLITMEVIVKEEPE